MDAVPIGTLIATLIFLLALSAFFSASETAMMALNRYRLKHLAESGHRGARLAQTLLEKPDRLLGVILLGNNAANLTAAAIAGLIAFGLVGEQSNTTLGIGITTFALTLVLLIFAEVAPKTLAALYPERIAFPAAYVLYGLMVSLWPLVRWVSMAGNGVLRLFGVKLKQRGDQLSAEELRSVVQNAGGLIPPSHQDMLLRILELEKITVDDVMVPRASIEAIDIEDDWDEIVDQLKTSHHTLLPVYRRTLDNIIGIIHLRKILHLSQGNEFNLDGLLKIMREPYFIPEGSPLTQQLLNFRSQARRIGLVVDEYGDLKGLVTLDEILEEIVGEFAPRVPGLSKEFHAEEDGSFLVNGSANIRDLNRKLGWELPTDGPKTLNGLILEYLEDIPHPGTSLRLAGYPVEIMQTRGTAVTMARVRLPEAALAREATA